MEITEVRIKLVGNQEDRLRGFCSVTFDHSFVVRDLKIIEGNNGPFVAMPSRKLTSNCRKCRTKNHLRANYCNQCGSKLGDNRLEVDDNGRPKLYADIAHPINAKCREVIQNRIVEELEKEIVRAQHPNYRSRYDEGYEMQTSPPGGGNRSDRQAERQTERVSDRPDETNPTQPTSPESAAPQIRPDGQHPQPPPSNRQEQSTQSQTPVASPEPNLPDEKPRGESFDEKMI